MDKHITIAGSKKEVLAMLKSMVERYGNIPLQDLCLKYGKDDLRFN